jgi:hypothetical protein
MYIPKNRIVTNLRTTQNEFVYKSTGESYNGVYWKDYKGKFYAGTNPNVTPRYEIIRVIPIEDYKDPYQPKSQVAITEGPTPFINEDDGPYDEEIITTYARLKKVDTINPEQLNLPSMYYPKPTDKDYKLGEFRRYFIVRINSNTWMEVDKNTYKKISSFDTSWECFLFVPAYIDWVITGDQDKVEETNRNLVELTQFRMKKQGLKRFLQQDYLKFYKIIDEETQDLPSQDELNAPPPPTNDGNNY